MNNIKIFIEGELIDPDSFVVPPMSLSSSKENMKHHDFELEVPKSTIIELMKKEYNQWRKESKEEDAMYDEPQDELGKAGYPEIGQVLESKELTELVFGDYLVRELLEKITGKSPAHDFKYWFDTVTDCNINKDVITLKGICFSKP